MHCNDGWKKHTHTQTNHSPMSAANLMSENRVAFSQRSAPSLILARIKTTDACVEILSQNII